MKPDFQTPAVAEKFASYPAAIRARLLALRQLVFDVAAETSGVGHLEEALKWGQPSYLTPETGSGTTIRIDAYPGGRTAIFVNCKTDLVAIYKTHYPQLSYEGVRAIVLASGKLDKKALGHCIALALTYHARKKRG